MKYFVLMVMLCIATPAIAAERILALSPHACEILFAIGAGAEVVGVSAYSDYPKAAQALPHLADFRTVFTETALRLKPDLIVAENPALRGLGILKKAGIRIVVTHPHHLDDIFSDIQMLGRETGHQQQANALAAQLNARMHTVQLRNTGQSVPIFIEVWSRPLMTQGGKSFITEIIHAAGGRNVFADVAVESMRTNVEAILKAMPQVIIVPSKSGDIASRKQFWKKWLPKAKVLAINPDLFNRPGPRIVDGIEILQHDLQTSNQ